eukprot:CAMPEP_0178888682 /NCGR_PEP_ID=MMETSP0747-20121128/17311_1 /TAXON_ID=913974 /ORGANISM="Nitzschia punctata, Strain CCMP561" /LENGTH=565 /DNA_ID=CAMNT_0020558027 /DNA_START=510 /DNA_END=2208 /DNA_ORIENTATION=-
MTTKRSTALFLSSLCSLLALWGLVSGFTLSAFQSHPLATTTAATSRTSTARQRIPGSMTTTTTSVPAKLAISVEELEKDLTPSERSVTSVVRRCGASVAFVTSVWPTSSSGDNANDSMKTKNLQGQLPPGQSLGSGSGFVVSPDGYLCTNFHVIERAYTLQTNADAAKRLLDQFAGNFTTMTPFMFSSDFVNFTKSLVQEQLLPPLPQIYVRIDSATKYQNCRIVGVNTDLDLAVLKVMEQSNDSSNSNPKGDEDSSNDDGSTSAIDSCVSFGSSSDLLVGQSVVAIGNPFGLDTTVTTGVVSAVNREFRAGTARTPANTPIRNVIQTDAAINPGNSGGPLLNLKGEVVLHYLLPNMSFNVCSIRLLLLFPLIQPDDAAINPGNSGGPLLNLKGEVVGINTAIITTSGSSAGIGFAVPADQLQPAVQRIIWNDRQEQQAQGGRKAQGWLGVSILRQPVVDVEKDDSNTTSISIPLAKLQNWVVNVERNSPASDAGIRPLLIMPDAGGVVYGDAIVAVGGNEVKTLQDLQTELSTRVVGEQLALTVEDASGDRRVVYVTLSKKPSN